MLEEADGVERCRENVGALFEALPYGIANAIRARRGVAAALQTIPNLFRGEGSAERVRLVDRQLFRNCCRDVRVDPLDWSEDLEKVLVERFGRNLAERRRLVDDLAHRPFLRLPVQLLNSSCLRRVVTSLLRRRRWAAILLLLRLSRAWWNGSSNQFALLGCSLFRFGDQNIDEVVQVSCRSRFSKTSGPFTLFGGALFAIAVFCIWWLWCSSGKRRR